MTNKTDLPPDLNPLSKSWWAYAVKHPLYLIFSLLGLALGLAFIVALLGFF